MPELPAGSSEQQHESAAPADHDADHASSDLCCDILGHLDIAAAPARNQQPRNHFVADFVAINALTTLYNVNAADLAPASTFDHGPAPPPRPWPQFTKNRSQAPPAYDA